MLENQKNSATFFCCTLYIHRLLFTNFAAFFARDIRIFPAKIRGVIGNGWVLDGWLWYE